VRARNSALYVGMRLLIFIALAFLSSTAHAVEERLNGEIIKAVLSDKVLTANTDGRKIEQIFQASGLTLYIVDGQQSQGTWKVEGDKYCSQWPPSQIWACYDVTRENEIITFISSSGTRYPMALPLTK
jgi:hypothetical protein